MRAKINTGGCPLIWFQCTLLHLVFGIRSRVIPNNLVNKGDLWKGEGYCKMSQFKGKIAGCADGWTYSNHNGLCYKYQSTKLPWTEARAYCQDLSAGGDLASVPDQATNDFLRKHVTTVPTVPSWIGATDEGSEGSWRWSDGSAWGYENWAPGNPDNFNSNQHHALFNWGQGSGLWDDADDYWAYPFICQSTSREYEFQPYSDLPKPTSSISLFLSFKNFSSNK